MIQSSARRSSLWPLVLAIAAVGPAAIMIRLAEAPPITVAAGRLVVAAFTIGCVALFRRGRDLEGLDRAAVARSILSGIFLAIHFATWITSLAFTSVANSVIIVTTQPIWAALLGIWFLRERVSAITFVAIALAFSGVIIISGGNPQSGGRLGDLLALIGAITAAAYLVVGRQVRRRASTLGYVLVAYSTAAVALLIWGLIIRTQFAGLPASSWLWIVATGLGPSVIGHTLYNLALREFSAHAVATTILGGETLLATGLAMIVLHEYPSPWAVIGAVPIAIGVVWTLRLERAQVMADQT